MSASAAATPLSPAGAVAAAPPASAGGPAFPLLTAPPGPDGKPGPLLPVPRRPDGTPWPREVLVWMADLLLLNVPFDGEVKAPSETKVLVPRLFEGLLYGPIHDRADGGIVRKPQWSATRPGLYISPDESGAVDPWDHVWNLEEHHWQWCAVNDPACANVGGYQHIVSWKGLACTAFGGYPGLLASLVHQPCWVWLASKQRHLQGRISSAGVTETGIVVSDVRDDAPLASEVRDYSRLYLLPFQLDASEAEEVHVVSRVNGQHVTVHPLRSEFKNVWMGAREVQMTHDSHMAGSIAPDGRRLPALVRAPLCTRGEVPAELINLVCGYLLFERVPCTAAAPAPAAFLSGSAAGVPRMATAGAFRL